jgi:hypothetical protein
LSQEKKIALIKKLYILTILLTIPVFSRAQFSIGLQGGANLSQMDFTNNQEYRFTEIDNMQGFIGGVVLQFLGDKHTGIQAEFNYVQRGWIENDTTGSDDLKYKNRMDYVEIPIITHINIGGGRLRGLFNIGPYLGFALNRTITTENVTTGSSESSEYSFDSKNDNQFDFGLMAGGGLEYRLNHGKIAAEARYTVGLGDINKEKTYQSEVSQFRIITILVRYTIPLVRQKADPETDPQ